ncbi:MAG: AAA family ATPase, partial [Lysinibacillus sp.]
MAPEETGRVNSGVDFQTDLYSLGVIFYEMLTGHQIYEGQGEGLLYQMLTKEPKSFVDLKIDVPAIIEKIVFKLLSKNKEDRYQSAIGLKEDLIACWYKLTNQIALTDFQLARYDEHGKWRLSEINPVCKRTLKQLIQNMNDGQRIQVIIGPKSSGKTYLLKQLHQYYYRQQQSSYMIAPQMGSNTLNIPIIFLALRHKILQLIQSNKVDQLKHQASWPSFIPNSVIYFLPELRTLQSQLRFSEEQEYIEQQQLFQVLVQLTEYLNVENNEILFLVDDYELLDDFTQQFLQFVMTQYSDKQLIFSADSLEKVEQFGYKGKVAALTIDLLTQGEIFDWLSTSLKYKGDALKQCARLLSDVTNGIPLYINTFFNDICELQILKYSVQELVWHFDVTKIHLLDLANYSEFINDTLNNLTSEQQLIVQYAVCLGSRFDITQLFEIVPYDYSQTLHLFIQLVEKRVFIILQEQFSMLELIVDLNMLQEFDMYVQFFNDDMLQRAKGMLTDDQKERVHATIVDYLCKREIETTEQKRRLLYHLQQIEHKLMPDQLHTYLSISKELGNMTLKNGVFHEALRFSRVFEDKMPKSYWEEHYELAMAGNVLHANALYLNEHAEKAQPFFELALKQAKSIEDKLLVYNEKSLFMTFSQLELPVACRVNYVIGLAD